MKFFKKVSAIAASALMIGMTAGIAAAASYPSPFVVSGSADVAIVYGANSPGEIDAVPAGNIQTDLQSSVTATGGGEVTTSGELVPLDTSSTRIWLNTSLNAAKDQITKADLPTVLADYTFTGDTTSKLTFTIKIPSGDAAGGANSGKVIFAKQPESGDDPVIGISMGTSASQPLYNASATMSAINFTDSDTEGEEIVLFGQSFTVSSESDSTKIVLLKEAQTVSLTNDNPSTTVTVGGSDYTVELVSASDTSATIKVTDSSGASSIKEINEAQSKTVQGLDVAVKTADESNFQLSATLIIGAQKITLRNGSTVTVGENDDPIDGTTAYIVGGTTATTEIAVAVYAPDSSNDAILGGDSFVDPVFGSFKIQFAGLSSPLADSERETITVQPSGQKDMSITMTDNAGNEKTFIFAHNESSQWRLADSSNYSIAAREMANLSYAAGKSKYVLVGNEEYGHLLELYDVYNQTTGTGSVTNDRVKFKDVITGDTYSTTFTSTEGQGTLDVGGKRYTVTFQGTGENAGVQVKYPTSEDDGSHGSGDIVVYPTIKTKNGGLVALYEPLTLDLSDIDGSGTDVTKLVLPDGDGYTSITLEYVGNLSDDISWNVTGGGVTDESLNTNGTGDYVDFTVGQLTYNLTAAGTNNNTILYLTEPGGTANINNPAVVFFEGKDDNTEYHVVVIDLEDAPAGDSNDGVGVEAVRLTSDTQYSAVQATDTDITEYVDWYGTHVTYDTNTASQAKATISYPKNQVYAQVYIGEEAATVTSGEAGDVLLVKDTEIDSVKDKNLVVVGGSCVNSVAATLVGGAYCGSEWTGATGVGSGEFLIQSFGDAYTSGKVAVLVAGYEAADTNNAATYLINEKPDVSAGKKYKGTSATEATLVTTEA